MSRIVRLAILESYGVRWSHETFARDLLQNFFDSTPDFREISLSIQREERTAEIKGPTVFDLDLLAYIGATTKNEGKTVGGFGEGFKICALVGLRDFGVRLLAGSGEYDLEAFFDPVALGRELCYRVTERPAPYPGSYVRLEGCDDACLDALMQAPLMFRHPENPHLKKIIVEDAREGVAVYSSPFLHHGEIYYRRQLRGEVRFYSASRQQSVTLVHDPPIDALEGDRDRRDLPPRLVARSIGEKLSPEALYQVLLHLMPYWRYGNEVLAGFLEAGMTRKLSYSWPPGWLASPPAYKDRGLTALAERQGFQIAQSAFASLGMPTPLDRYSGDLQTRPPTPLEKAQIEVVADLYRDLYGSAPRTKAYEVFDEMERAAVRGQHLGDRLIVGAPLLAKGLDGSVGTLLHEFSHEAGGEEAPAFLSRLKQLIGGVAKAPDKVTNARRRYEEITARGVSEESPAPEEKPETEGFYPEQVCPDTRDRNGVICTLIVPPSFPPAEEIREILHQASLATEIPIFVIPDVITGPKGALFYLAPGVPTLQVGPWDVEEGAEERTDVGFRLRTYEGGALCPPQALIEKALRRAKDEGLIGRGSFSLFHDMRDQLRERLRAHLGLLPKDPPEQKKQRDPTPLETRNEEVIEKLLDYTSFYDSLADLWGWGIFAAGKKLLEALPQEGSAEEIFAQIEALLQPALRYARRLRAKDPDFDDADKMERDAMNAAQGVAVLSYVQEENEEDKKKRAARDFQTVRALTGELWDMELDLRLKSTILEHALQEAGMDEEDTNPSGIDPAILKGEFFRAARLAQQEERSREDQNLRFSSFDLEKLLKQDAPSTNTPEQLEKRKKHDEDIKRYQKEREHKNRVTLVLRQIYEETLAKTDNEHAAATRLIEEAARLLPEPEEKS